MEKKISVVSSKSNTRAFQWYKNYNFMTKFRFLVFLWTTTILIFEKWLMIPNDQATTSDTSDK